MKHYLYLRLNAILVLLMVSLNATSSDLIGKIDSLIKGKRMTVGVATECNGVQFTFNDSLHFPLLSVFKVHVAMAAVDKMQNCGISADSIIHISKKQLHPNTYSPLREKYGVVDLELSLKELIEYTIIYSDNNTCDILINFIGGVDKANEYIKSLGIKNCNIVVNEDDMHKDFKNQYLNTSTPIDIVNLLNIFYHKDLFLNKYKEFLINTMIATKTGNKKIRYLLPKNIKVGDKTGSGDRIENNIKVSDNDSGFIVLPNGEVYFLSIFIYNSKESDEENARIIAEISKEIYDFIARN